MTGQTIEKTTLLVEKVIRSSAIRFKKYGYGKTTVAEIASDLHISKKTLYSVFPSKEEIIREAAWRETVDVMRRFNNSVPPDIRSDSLLIALCRFIFLDRIKQGKLGLFWGMYNEEPEIHKAYYSALKRVFAALYEDGRKQGLFKPVHHVFAAELVVNMIISASEYFHVSEQPVQMFDAALKMIADAVAHKDRIVFDAMG